MRQTCGILCCFLIVAGSVRGGYVQTSTGRIEGQVVLEKGQLIVGGKNVAWNEALFISNTSPRKTLFRSQWIHFRNGESWAVELVGLAGQEFKLRSDLFGVKTVDVDLVAAVDFAAEQGRPEDRKSEVLYRSRGANVPGKLLAIQHDKITFDSTVGEIDFPRDELISYRYGDSKPERKDGEDEVVLIDGSVFWGKLSPVDDGLKMEHQVLGTLTLPFRIVRSIVRHPSHLLDLTELPPRLVEAAPLFTTGSAAATVQTLRRPEERSDGYVKGLAVEPKIVLHYALPQGIKGKGRWSAVLQPTSGSRGDVHLQVRVGQKVLLDKELSAGAKMEAVAVEVSSGEELEIRVDFGDRMRFPCGIVLGDMHVLWEKP